MHNVFVLSYSRANDFFNTYSPHKDIKYHLIDNGNQSFEAFDNCFVYATDSNIGCAGGWNLIASIAFDYFGLDKILITQDDITLPDYLFLEAFDLHEEGSILGIFQPFFEFSSFILSKSVYEKVGKFDENFKFVYAEDADYKQRCLHSCIPIKSMYWSGAYNSSASIFDDPGVNNLQGNLEYLREKWGPSINNNLEANLDNQPPYEYSRPKKPMWYSEPSELEYNRFLNKHNRELICK